MEDKARRWQALAVAGLLLAIGLVAAAIHATLKAGELIGPGAAVLSARGELWLQVDRQLWRLAPDGRLLQVQDVAALGLPGPPSHLVRHPSGAVAATVRDEPALYLLDPASARVVRTLQPQWPAELAPHGARAIDIAFDDNDGRIAIATGGGHAVVLFAPDGRWLARTAPGTYRFTNGLWWSDGALWTTDTNRFQLKRLDGHTLAVQRTLTLPADHPARYLGSARPWPGPAAAGAPLVALLRLRNGMITGRPVLVGTDGSEQPLPKAEGLEPGDLEWIGGSLVVADSASFRLRRWSAAGEALPDFGDAGVRAALQRRFDERQSLTRRHRVALAAGAAVFGLALVFALLAQRARRRQRPAPPSVLAPAPGWRAQVGLRLRAFWPLLPMLLPWALLQWPGLRHAAQAALGPRAAMALLIGALALTCVLMVLLLRRLRRLARLTVFEPLFNEIALRKLRGADPALLALQPGERVQETFVLATPLGRWAVLTDRRLLLFKATLLDQQPGSTHARADIVAASAQRGALQPARFGSGWLNALGSGGWLELRLRSGRVIAGAVSAPTVALRVAQQLSAPAAPGCTPQQPGVPSSAAAARGPSRRLAALASALVPGLGQWWQRRPAAALLLFLPAAGLALASTVPVLWIWHGPRAEVSPRTVLMAVGAQLACAALAAFDAWHMGRSRA